MPFGLISLLFATSCFNVGVSYLSGFSLTFSCFAIVLAFSLLREMLLATLFFRSVIDSSSLCLALLRVRVNPMPFGKLLSIA